MKFIDSDNTRWQHSDSDSDSEHLIPVVTLARVTLVMDNITLVDGSVMVNSDNNATHRDNYSMANMTLASQCGEELTSQEWETVSQYR